MPRSLPAVLLCLALIAPVLSSGSPARADDPAAPGDKSNADREQLRTESSQLKQKLGNFNTRVENDLHALQNLSDPKAAQTTVAELQAEISDALSATADNGKIALLAEKVLETERGWLKDVPSHGFSPEREAFLTQSFRTMIAETQKTIDGVTAIRQQLAATLKHLQGEQDYLQELARIDQGKQMLTVLQGLLEDMRSNSDNLNILMNGVPGA